MNHTFASVSLLVALATPALAGTVATDSAANYTSWGQNQQDQGGQGFGPWIHLFQIPSTGGFAGQFLGTANNPDLNNVGPTAWALYSNNGGAGGSGIQKAASLRTFTSGNLMPGQSFSIQMENGNVRAGNGNPNNGPVDFGWVGVVLRSGTEGQELEEPFSPFGELKGTLAIGFLGGSTEYFVYDAVSPSGRSTGVPFTTAGIAIEVAYLVSGPQVFNAEVRITPLGVPNAQTVTVPARIASAVDTFAIYSRNAEFSDTYFNRAQITQAGQAPCDSIDFNNDGATFDPTDIEAFLSVFSEGPCIPAEATCNDIDFNNDGSLFDPCDIDAFLFVFSEGPCAC
jgi:hypothetical protein